MEALNPVEYISFVKFSNFVFFKLNTPVFLNAGTTGSTGDPSTWHWINGNIFTNFVFNLTRAGVQCVGGGNAPFAAVSGNLFKNFMFEQADSSTSAFYFSGAAGNQFDGQIWDWAYGSAPAIEFVNGAENNVGFTNISEVGVQGDLTSDQANKYTSTDGFSSGVTYSPSNLAIGGYLTIETPNSPGVLPVQAGWKVYQELDGSLSILQLVSPYNKIKVSSSLQDGLIIDAGVVTLVETTTPTAIIGSGKIYTKSNNKLYFQDGGGTEHEIAFV